MTDPEDKACSWEDDEELVAIAEGLMLIGLAQRRGIDLPSLFRKLREGASLESLLATTQLSPRDRGQDVKTAIAELEVCKDS